MKHIHCAFIKIGVAGDLMAVRMIYHQSTSKCASEQAHQRMQVGMVQHGSMAAFQMKNPFSNSDPLLYAFDPFTKAQSVQGFRQN